MTHEERFTRIENAFNMLAEHHARHAEEIAELRSMQKVMLLAIERTAEMQQESAREFRAEMKECREQMKESRERMEEWREEWTSGMQELRDAQQVTEEKLHVLIDTVDRIIRSQGGQA